MRITQSIIRFVLLALVLSACVPVAQQAADAPAESDLETDFELVLYQGADVLGGEKVKFSDVLAQGKPVVLIMWASSCPSCLVDMVFLERARADYEDEVLFVGLHIGHFVGLGSEEGALAFLEDEGIAFPNGYTPESSVVRDYEVLNTPSIYYFKPDGERARGSRWVLIATFAVPAVLVVSLLFLLISFRGGIEAGVADLARLLPVGYAFAAGMVASVNPCGIMMLTSYAFYQMRGKRAGATVARRVLWGLIISFVVTVGFVLIFALVGSAVSAGGQWLANVFPYAGLVIGIGIVQGRLS